MTAQLHPRTTRLPYCERCGINHKQPQADPFTSHEYPPLTPTYSIRCHVCDEPLMDDDVHQLGQPCSQWDLPTDPLYAMSSEMEPNTNGAARIPRGPVRGHLALVPEPGD